MAFRKCVVCGQSMEQREALRFTFEQGCSQKGDAGGISRLLNSLRIDVQGNAFGRGAYCHLDEKCFCSSALVVKLALSLLRKRQEEFGGGKKLARMLSGHKIIAQQDLICFAMNGAEQNRKLRIEKGGCFEKLQVVERLKWLAGLNDKCKLMQVSIR